MRKFLLITVVAGVAVLAIGINRIVVTDGHIDAVAMHGSPQVVAFKSDYLPLERA
jgi:hypothetical protein